MRIVVMTEKTGWHTEDLRRAALARGHTLVTCSWVGLRAELGGEASQQLKGLSRQEGIREKIASESIQLRDADAVIVRTMPAGSLEQIVFRMDVLYSLEKQGVVVVNRPVAVEISVDKYRSLSLMKRSGLLVPETIVCQGARDALDAFKSLSGDVVVKPVFGSEGFGVMRLSDIEMAKRAFATLEQMQRVMYIQQFVGCVLDDVRLFVVGGKVVAAMKRVGSDWRKNIARGATAQPFEPDDAMCEMAVQAAKSCEVEVGGVDLLRVEDPRDREGGCENENNASVYALEVNASPGWRALSSVSECDVASCVIDLIERKVDASVVMEKSE
jgi:RimK family alpha-L-glutamate ligase